MIKHVKNLRFAIAKLAFWHEALLCGIGHQNGWKKSRPFWALTKLWFTWYGLGGYSCKSPYKYSTDTLRWYATYVETSHFTLCFHKQNKGSLILHGICTTFECCLKVRNPDSQHVFCFVYLSCMCFHCIFPIETHAWWIFHGISRMDSRYCFCFDICAHDEVFCGNLWYGQWYC